jgi:LDH2 family malate/lactate/ureidoglycolate dehydrogenase
MRDGKTNSNPNVRVVRETPTSLLVDGDGGLGYFPTYEGTLWLIEKAKAQGVGVLMTRNHGHFGAAGIYARQTLEHDLLTFVTSGFGPNLSPDMPVHKAVGGSPFAFSAPTEEEDPVVLDIGALHDLRAHEPLHETIVRESPGILLRAMGLGAICQAWGGLLAGVPPDNTDPRDPKSMGSLVITFQISLFMEPAEFKRRMDDYVRSARTMVPLEGFDQAHLAGGPEAALERIHREEGIPLGPEHRTQLENMAEEIGIEAPWQGERQ